MSLVMKHFYSKVSKTFLILGASKNQNSTCGANYSFRSYGNDNTGKYPEFIDSTILIEDGLNVRELPLVVRKIRDLSCENISSEPIVAPDGSKFHLIQAEFSQSKDLRDIFSLLSKCSKITPNIALGAIERICELEKGPNLLTVDTRMMNAQLAKGAILDKLLKVVIQTEDTQTLLNAIKVDSSILEPYKYKFSDELLLRVIDGKLSIQQLVEFVTFLANNKKDSKYEETIDKLWVGFVEKQDEISEKNFVQLLHIVCHFKTSKSTIMLLLEKKLWSFWWKLTVLDMQEILNIFTIQNNILTQSLSIVGRWLNTNIHNLDEDSLLEFITKLTRLQYTDMQIENVIERYIKLKGSKIESQVLVVGILNYCMAFKIRNKIILNGCSKYFVKVGASISHSFLKSFIYPFGFLYFNPENSESFWKMVQAILHEKYSKISYDDLLNILLSMLYVGQQPLSIVDKIFIDYYSRIMSTDHADKLKHKLYLIDTACSLESHIYKTGFTSEDHMHKLFSRDVRIKNLIREIEESVKSVANKDFNVTTSVLVPNVYPDETYVIDFLLHVGKIDDAEIDWTIQSEKNKIIAILVHLPEHYCYNSSQLIGSQMMRKKHLRLMGLRVVSLSYTLICKLESNKIYLERYIKNSLDNAEMFL